LNLEYYLIYPKRIQLAREDGGIVAKFVARKPEKEVISMRISIDTLKEIDDKASAVGISRNELINQMIAYALENMDDTSSNE
jgi:hypothetical protein